MHPATENQVSQQINVMKTEKEKEKNEQLPEGELKVISIDCPDQVVIPIPQEDIPKAFASFLTLKLRRIEL